MILGTAQARVNGPAFVVGWLLGLVLVGVIVLLVVPDDTTDGPPTWASALKLALGALLVLLAVKQWRGRVEDDEEPSVPRWVGELGGLSAPRALGMGAALAAANPKNLLLTVAAAAAIAETGIPGGEQLLAYAVFVVIGTLGVGVPVVMYLALGERAAGPLEELERWMARNSATILCVLFLVIGAKLIGDAISGFSA